MSAAGATGPADAGTKPAWVPPPPDDILGRRIARLLDEYHRDADVAGPGKGKSPPNLALPTVTPVAAVPPEIIELNKEFSVVRTGRDVNILTFRESQLHRGVKVPEFMSERGFRLWLKNRTVLVKTPKRTTKVPLADHWLTHPDRKSYEGVTFAPGESSEVSGLRNLWTGWGVTPAPGDWRLMREHIFNALASGDHVAASYIIRWTAWTFQNPATRAGVALAFLGGRGVGKSTYGNAMCAIFGPHGLQVSSREDLVGKFNSHMMQCSLLFADEAIWPGHKEDEGTLKRIITEPTLNIEPKGIDKFTVPNCLHLIMASNPAWMFPAGDDERRAAVFKVDETHKQDTKYFEPLYHEMRNGGLAAMLFDLLALDLGKWNPRDNIPQTEALAGQKMLSSPVARWIVALATEGVLPGATTGHADRARSRLLWEHARRSPGLRHASIGELVAALEPFGVVQVLNNGSFRGFPSLPDFRAACLASYPGLVPFSNPNADWQEDDHYDF